MRICDGVSMPLPSIDSIADQRVLDYDEEPYLVRHRLENIDRSRRRVSANPASHFKQSITPWLNLEAMANRIWGSA